MKKVFNQACMSSIFCALFLLITSCGEDESFNQDDLTGTWEIITISSTSCDDPSDNMAFDLSDDPCVFEQGIEICVEGTLSLTSSGNFTLSLSLESLGTTIQITENGTYTLTDNDIELCQTGSTECGTGTISIAGDLLTLSANDPEDGCHVNLTARRS